MKNLLQTEETIIMKILLIRNQKIMTDADLAELYGITTKRLNEQVKRNINRFPTDFMFQLSAEEKEELVVNCDHLYNVSLAHAYPVPKGCPPTVKYGLYPLGLGCGEAKKDHKQDQDIKLIFATLKN